MISSLQSMTRCTEEWFSQRIDEVRLIHLFRRLTRQLWLIKQTPCCRMVRAISNDCRWILQEKSMMWKSSEQPRGQRQKVGTTQAARYRGKCLSLRLPCSQTKCWFLPDIERNTGLWRRKWKGNRVKGITSKMNAKSRWRGATSISFSVDTQTSS